MEEPETMNLGEPTTETPVAENVAESAESGTTAEPDLSALNDEERSIYAMSKGMGNAEINTLPPDVKKEILAVREKLNGATDAVTPVAEVQPSNETTAAVAETTPATTVEAESAPVVDKTEEIIRRLTEENRKYAEENRRVNARYESLKGKYNAEVKNVRKSEQQPVAAGTENNAETLPAADSGMSDDDIAKFAEAEGIDSDVALTLAKIARKIQQGNGQVNSGIDANTAERVNELYYARQNELFDAAIRKECRNKVGLEEVNTHPLFPSYAKELYDEKGVSAWDAIIEARNNHDHASAASVINQVFQYMDERDMWDLSNRHAGTAAPAPAAANPDSSATAVNGLPAVNNNQPVKPSAVTPHSASGVSTTLHTARTIDDVSREYDQLEKQFRRTGDSTLVPRMAQLSKEFGRLAAAQMHNKQP